jgi:hypothetical protein
LVDVYRRLVPERLRRVVSRRFPPTTRDKVEGWLRSGTRIGRWLHDRWIAAAARGLAREWSEVVTPDRTVVIVGRHPKVAIMDTDLSGFHAREENLAGVRSALAAADVEHFSVRGRWDRASVVGVSAADRERAVAALSHVCRRLPGYASDMTALLPGQESPDVSWPGFRSRTWRRVSRSSVIRLTFYRTDPQHRVVLGTPYGCDVEFWTPEDERLVGPRPNLAVPAVSASAGTVAAPAWSFTRLASPFGRAAAKVSTRPELVGSEPADVPFPIDVVCVCAATAASADALRYTLRSLHMFAPWARTIHVVTDADGMPWVDPTRVRLIRGGLMQIDELSDHFVYLCEGTVIGTDVTPDLFFHGNGIAKRFGRGEVPAHALRREVLLELPPGSLPSVQQERAFRTARAAPGTIRHTSIDLSVPGVDSQLSRLAAVRDQHIIGLPVVRSARLADFLATYFPLPVPYERSCPP